LRRVRKRPFSRPAKRFICGRRFRPKSAGKKTLGKTGFRPPGGPQEDVFLGIDLTTFLNQLGYGLVGKNLALALERRGLEPAL